MPFLIIIMIIIGSGVIVFILLLLKNILGPRKIEQLIELLNQNKTGLVIKFSKKLITRDPRNTSAHFVLGNAYMAEGSHDLALVEYKTINMIGVFDQKYCPEIQFRKEIAKLFIEFEQIDEALKEFLLLIQLEPFNAENYYNAGTLFEERHTNETAVQYYQKTIEIDKQHSDAHYRLGHLYYRQKKTVEARIELETALRYNNENYKAHYYMGRILKEAHDFANALHHLDEALKDPDSRVRATIEKGNTYIHMGKYEKAIPDLQRAINQTTDEASNDMLYARYYLAMCYENIRDLEHAVEQWERIYAKKPSFHDIAVKLSQYQELRIDDHIKDYLTVKNEDFVKICKLVVDAMNLQIREVAEFSNCCQVIAVESESKWRNARKLPRLIRFYRISDAIKDSTVRQIHEEMKKLNVNRCVIFTSSGFTKSAQEFAETRPIDLFGKDKLQELLGKTNIR